MGVVTGSVDQAGSEWLQYDYARTRLVDDEPRPVTMWRYRALLPLGEGPVRYPLPVGGTPLLPPPWDGWGACIIAMESSCFFFFLPVFLLTNCGSFCGLDGINTSSAS